MRLFNNRTLMQTT